MQTKSHNSLLLRPSWSLTVGTFLFWKLWREPKQRRFIHYAVIGRVSRPGAQPPLVPRSEVMSVSGRSCLIPPVIAASRQQGCLCLQSRAHLSPVVNNRKYFAALCSESVDINGGFEEAAMASAPQWSVHYTMAARVCWCKCCFFVCGGGPFLPFTDNLLDRLLKPRPKPAEQLEPLRDW